MLYCVTGATGLLGNNLVRQLLESGHQVRIAVRPTSNLATLQDLDVEIVTGDLNEPEFATRLVEGTDGLFHVAGFVWFGHSKRKQSMRINVDASKTLAEACINQQTRMVYVSSTDALGAGTEATPANESCLDPAKGDSAYVASKRAAERALLEMHDQQDLNVVIVNPGLFFGPYDWSPSSGLMILAVTDGYVPFAPRGGISTGDVRQVAKGIQSAMQSGKTANRYILGGENLTYLELWTRLAALAGRKGPLSKIPPRIQTAVGFGGDFLAKVTRKESNVNSAALHLGSLWNYYDSSKAIEELGYEPGDLQVAIRDAWDWLVENGYSRKHKPESGGNPNPQS